VSLAAVVPANATAAIINLTATGQTAPGFLTASPTCPTSARAASTSTLNYLRGRPSRANMAVVGLSADSLCIYNSGGPVDAVVDVIGYLTPYAAANYVPLAHAVRLADTRPATRVGPRATPLGPQQTMAVQAGGAPGIPGNAVAVMSAVVAVNETASGFFEIYPTATTRPTLGSTVNFGIGQTVPNAAVANLNSGGTTSIYNQWGKADAVFDVSGYFGNAVPAAP